MIWTKVNDRMLDLIPKRDVDKKASVAFLNSTYCVMAQDNFTVLLVRNNGHMVMGVAKRNPRDKFSPKIAGDVATVRAYRSFKKAYYEV